jgi:hypothetical protein
MWLACVRCDKAFVRAPVEKTPKIGLTGQPDPISGTSRNGIPKFDVTPLVVRFVPMPHFRLQFLFYFS